MEFVEGINKKEICGLKEMLQKELPASVQTEGAVHSVRDMGDVIFIILRSREGLFQVVCENGQWETLPEKIREGMAVRVNGQLREEKRAPHGRELALKQAEILSVPETPLPLAIDKWKLSASLEAKLNMRALSLRNPRERAAFRVQEGLTRAFRDFLNRQGFTEIHTPKIGARGAEGGANMFRLEYFHQPAVLAQSPQFYKQIMAGVFDRVFETGPVFRAEKHNTKRHLNEYTSLDFEMGYIDGFEEVMETETGYLQYAMEFLKEHYQEELDRLSLKLPAADRIPRVRFTEAKRLVSEKYGRSIRNPHDLEPEEEQLISRYFLEEYGAEFVFVTHYPSKKRPFYAMDDPEDPRYTLSFDLLFRGVEVTTGGQRIHDYKALTRKIADRGMTEEGLEFYLDAFRYGMPPHGGLGIGLERLTMQLLGAENVREACLFPRDMNRLTP